MTPPQSVLSRSTTRHFRLRPAPAATTAAAGLGVGYTSGTGVLSITGSASVATYQTILQGILYNNTSDSPTTTNRSIPVVASDGTDPSQMIWLGSIAWDGYPQGIDAAVLAATTKEEYVREALAFMEPRDDHTHPEQGWPWPWNDSGTTDYAYTFKDGRVVASCFGNTWFVAADGDPEDDEDDAHVPMPDMTAIQNLDFGKWSGVMFIQSP